MERAPDFEAVRAFFPWAYTAANRAVPLVYISSILQPTKKNPHPNVKVLTGADFFVKEYDLADHGLLGDVGFGYWAGMGKEIEIDASSDFLDGHALLSPLPSEKESWHNLPDEYIPWHNFSSTPPRPMPQRLEPDRVLRSWVDWYAWRGLPARSPAVLVMHHVLSIYYMLSASLGHRPLAAGAPRKELRVALLGAEAELNVLATLAELALLLPGYDVRVLLVGPAVQRLVQHAQNRYPTSPAAQKDGAPVFTYAAPTELGGSTVMVELYDTQPPADEKAWAVRGALPHTMLALRASISRAQMEWWPVVRDALYWDVPFVSTEDMEMGLSTFSVPVVHGMFDTAKEECDVLDPTQRLKFMMKVPRREQGRLCSVRYNTFHRLGNTLGHCHLPSAANGFVLEVVHDRGGGTGLLN